MSGTDEWVGLSRLTTEPRIASDGGLYTTPDGKATQAQTYEVHLLNGKEVSICGMMVWLTPETHTMARPIAFSQTRDGVRVVEDEKSQRRFVIHTNPEGRFVELDELVPEAFRN